MDSDFIAMLLQKDVLAKGCANVCARPQLLLR